ncbi:MAG: 50S ribosomal protein L24 [Clostridiales bacterium]|nr:50S ribosomal protein L24 [Clostridiales bacterium]
MTVKKGDTVLVITGKDKGKTGKVLEVFPKDNKVLVDGINIVTKHKKARSQQEKSEIIKKTAPIEVSNVMVVCSTCGKATRVAHKEIEGKNARVCKKCSASLDKEFVKATKKEAKKAIAEDKKPVEKKTTTKSGTKTTTQKSTKSAKTEE